MPGENCAVFGCGSCRRTKGIGIWKLPSAKDEAHALWRKEWLGEIKKTRDLDWSFKELMEKDHVYTCEKHFATEDIEMCKYSSYKSCDLCFYLQFNFALFTVWIFYTLAVLLILMVSPGLNFTSLVLFTVQSVKLSSTNAEYAAKEPRNDQTSAKT